MKDDPGRQAVRSINPSTDSNWTDVAYTGDTQALCRANVEKDLKFVEEWSQKDGVSLDTRDHTGRTPLHLACQVGSVEVAKCLIDHGVRIVSDPQTDSSHCTLPQPAAVRRLSRLYPKSPKRTRKLKPRNKNKQMELKQSEAQNEAKPIVEEDVSMDDNNDDASNDDMDEISSQGSEDSMPVTQGSFVKVDPKRGKKGLEPEDDTQEPDYYDNHVVAWDTAYYHYI